MFILNVADPGPLILGLRRTLGFQIVFNSLRPDPFPRLAGLGVITLAICLLWRRLVLLWGRSARFADEAAVNSVDRSPPVREAAWKRTLAYGVVLVPATILAWLPFAGLLEMSLLREPDFGNSHPLAGPGGLDLFRRLTEAPAPAPPGAHGTPGRGRDARALAGLTPRVETRLIMAGEAGIASARL